MDTPKTPDLLLSEPGPGRDEERAAASNFIRAIVDEDLKTGRHTSVITRFPPEPNGYLHIGHAKSICLNFGIAEDYRGVCHLRYDDTNPTTENVEYVQSIMDNVRWLGFDWKDKLFYASDYFERLYGYAVKLIRDGKAYVDSSTEEEIRAGRGTVTEPGRESPYRSRTVQENLDLFEGMRQGAYGNGEHVLRAKGDMASPNMKMRDPLLYRIRHAHHYRTGDAWCIYPMYDFAHPLSDAIERVTHSLCTLEFDNNRELYDWVLEHCLEAGELPGRPHQYEFARLNLEYTVMSKRKLLELVEGRHVAGWDDPRLPTLAGLRRRGITPEAIRLFCERIGVAKANSRVDLALLEHTLRDDLNFRAPRVLCVLRPLKVVITNYPEGEVEWIDASYWPHDVPREGTRRVPFARELFIERDDFMEHPSKKFFRLAPGREVRLRYAYFITCQEVVKDPATGEVVELRCTYDPATRGGDAPDGRRPKATLHWVSAGHALPAEVRLYDRLFSVPNPDEVEGDFKEHLDPESVLVLGDSRVEPSVADDPAETRYQFERQGYFWRDPVDSAAGRLVFNRIVGLRDTWAKVAQAGEAEAGEAEAASPEAPPPARQAPPERKAASGAPERPVEHLDAGQQQRLLHYTQTLCLQLDDALLLVDDLALASFFEEARAVHDNPRGIANWLINELLRERKGKGLAKLRVGGAEIGALVKLIDEGAISGRIAKEVFDEMLRSGEPPEDIVEKRGLRLVRDAGALGAAIDRLLADHPGKVEQYRGGKTGLVGFFMGQLMRETKGTADPELARTLLLEKLDG